MIRLFKYENYKVTISEEAILLKPFKAIWNRDRTKSKDRALDELGFIYFFCDPRSDYQYLTDETERKKAIKEGEGLLKNGSLISLYLMLWISIIALNLPLPYYLRILGMLLTSLENY